METQNSQLEVTTFDNEFGSGKIFRSHSTATRGLHFFGNRFLTENFIQTLFPKKKLVLLKQTHSNHVVDLLHTPDLNEESWIGDASLSRRTEHVLLVKTADCVPMLYMSPGLDLHGAIHAGWRGVENGIFQRFMEILKEEKICNGYFDLGPHITQKNFEVDYDVAVKIFSSVFRNPTDMKLFLSQNTSPSFFIMKGEKYYLNLLSVLKKQSETQLASEHMLEQSLVCDVYDDMKYFSHRRERSNPGRNLSFSARFEISEINSSLQLFAPKLG